MKRLQALAFLFGTTLALGSAAAAADLFRFQAKVVDTNGQPIAGATVEQYRGSDWLAQMDAPVQLIERRTTDAAGVATFSATGHTFFTLVGSKPGLSVAWTMWYPRAAQEEQTGELMLTAPANVSGMVQNGAGKPVRDAAVWITAGASSAAPVDSGQPWALISGQLGRQRLATRTGGDGRFRLEGLPADAVLSLGAAKAGLALDQPPQPYLQPNNLPYHAGQTDVVLTLKPAGAIEGRVVREDAGAPVAGARVTVGEGWFGSDVEPATTGPDGVFRLNDLRPGEHTLQVRFGTNRFPGWVCETVTASVEAGATNDDVKMTAGRGGVLEVTVREEVGEQPVKDATVVAFRERVGQNALTAGDGLARLRLVPGDYQLFVQQEDRRSGQPIQVSVERGHTNQVTVSLPAELKLIGTVTDPEGKPAARARVTLFPNSGTEKQTDAEGRFTLNPDANQFRNMQGIQQMVIVRDLTRNLAAVGGVEEEATNISLRLGPALTLSGRVTDPNGKAIANALAQVMLRTERMSSSLGAPVRADSQGRFEIKGLPTGQAYGVNVSGKGFGRASREVEAQDADKRHVEIEPIQLPVASLRIAGVVVDADDKPVAGAWVNSYGGEQPNVSGQTDAKGRFAFDQVCAGPIQLSANSPRGGGYGNVSAEGGDTNITIQLGVSHAMASSSGSFKLTGTVLDTDGKPAPKVLISLVPYSDEAKPADAEGRFKVSADPNRFVGMQDVQRVLVARDLTRNLAAALDVEPETTNANLRLGPALALAGRVTDTSGKPLTNAQVHLTFWTERMGSSLGSPVRVDAEGRYEIKGLPPGRRYGVNATAKGYGQDSRNVEAPEGESRRVEVEPLELVVADQRLAGVVVDDNDKPVARAWVNAYGNKQPSLNGQTDAKGRFTFDKVCAGRIQLSVSDQRGAYANVSAEGGDTNITVHLGASPGFRAQAPRPASLKGKPLPELAPLGVTAAEAPAGKALLAVLVDAEQRPSRRVLRLLGEQAASLKQQGVAVVVLQAGSMEDDAFTAWKQEAALPFPAGRLKGNAEKACAAWGAGALPWLILTDADHRVTAEGFAVEELDAKLKTLTK